MALHSDIEVCVLGESDLEQWWERCVAQQMLGNVPAVQRAPDLHEKAKSNSCTSKFDVKPYLGSTTEKWCPMREYSYMQAQEACRCYDSNEV